MNIRFLGAWFLILIAFVCLSAEEVVHIIRKGETIYSIARFYGINPDEVIHLNGLADPSRIKEGQRIKIPQGSLPGASTMGRIDSGAVFTEYLVSRGDTLSSIARRYGTTLTALLRENGFSEAHVLKIGERIRIPQTQALLPLNRTAPGEIIFGDVVPRNGVSGAADSIRWPVAAKEITYMTGKLYGVVLLGERSESVKSLTQGTVVSAGPYRGFGKVAIVQMAGGYLYVYGGCESLSVKEGDYVGPGAELGRLGVDGVSLKPQLFFVVYQGNTPIDPAKAPRA